MYKCSLGNLLRGLRVRYVLPKNQEQAPAKVMQESQHRLSPSHRYILSIAYRRNSTMLILRPPEGEVKLLGSILNAGC